jgi:hypothetical protein
MHELVNTTLGRHLHDEQGQFKSEVILCLNILTVESLISLAYCPGELAKMHQPKHATELTLIIQGVLC